MNKLFIPGPTEVRKDVLKQLSRPMVGHRSSEFKKLFEETTPKLQKVLATENNVFISTSSALGVMEACVRNCVKKKSLNLVCGNFSDRWAKMPKENGKESDTITVDLGKAIKPEMVEEKLSSGNYDSVFLTHNETSTGVMNPLREIAEVVKKYPDIVFIVDAVSSLTGVKIDIENLGIDVCLASVQKCFALPPGLAVFSCSQKALDRSKVVENRGYYFDFQQFLKYAGKSNTISTPAIPHIYALNYQLDKMLEEGMDNRFERHKKMAEFTRGWAVNEGFELFPEKGYESDTLTCMKNNKGINVADTIKKVKEKGMEFGNGYRDIKEKTFRIAHMGDLTLDEVKELTEAISEALK
jgi:predicted phosphoserine aminotransferase